MKEKLFERALDWAQRKGFKNIKANTDEYETPTKYMRSGDEEGIVPDLTGRLQGNKSFIEIALKSEDKQDLVSKWKLFSTLTTRKGGKLYLLAARGHKRFADDIVKDYNLPNTTVVSI